MKRIISFVADKGSEFFIPQWFDGHKWQNYYTLNKESPYVQLEFFRTQQEAEGWFNVKDNNFTDYKVVKEL